MTFASPHTILVGRCKGPPTGAKASTVKIIRFSDLRQEENVAFIRTWIREGGVLVYPTDTLYGLGGNFFSSAAAASVDALKGRVNVPCSVAVADRDMLRSLVAEEPEIFVRHFQRLLPGPYTFLFTPAPTLAPELLKNSGKIGIRIPALPPLLELIGACGVPWISTSVNRSGELPLNDPAAIARLFPGIAVLIDAGPLPPSAGSTVVDLTGVPPRIIRAGAGCAEAEEIIKEL